MEDIHGKEILLLNTTVKVPGRRPPLARSSPNSSGTNGVTNNLRAMTISGHAGKIHQHLIHPTPRKTVWKLKVVHIGSVNFRFKSPLGCSRNQWLTLKKIFLEELRIPKAWISSEFQHQQHDDSLGELHFLSHNNKKKVVIFLEFPIRNWIKILNFLFSKVCHSLYGIVHRASTLKIHIR